MKQSPPALTNSINFGAIIMLFLVLFALPACDSETPEQKFERLVSQAQQFKQNQKWDEARLSLLAALQIKTKHAESYFQLADTYAHLKEFGKAAENYRNALDFDPKHYEARLHLATLLIAAKENELAESHVNKLLESNADDTSALILLANIHKARGDIKAARATLNKALELQPKNVLAIANLGALAVVEGDLDLAEKNFQRVLKIEPESSPVRLALADLYTRQDRLQDAQTLLEGLVQDQPDNSSLRFYFGEFLLKRGLGNQALEEFRSTLQGSPENHTARDRLFDMYLNRNDLAKARALTAEILDLADRDPIVQYFQGRVAEIDGKPSEALAAYIRCIQAQPNFAPAFTRAGIIELAQGDTAAGIQHLNQAVATNPYDVSARLALARYAFSQRDFAGAREHLGHVLARYPRQISANVLMADIYLIDNDLDQARRVYQALTQAFPSHSIGYFKLGLLEERAGNIDTAIANYEKALQFDIEPLGAARRYAALLAQKEGVEAAYQEIEARALKSKHPGYYHYLLGLIGLSLPEKNEKTIRNSRDLFLKATQEEPDFAQAYLAIAGLDSMLGDTNEALKNYSTLVEKQPKNVTALMLLGLTLEKVERYEDASVQYRAALQVKPDFGPAANNLAYLLLEKLNGNAIEATALAHKAKDAMPRNGGVADTLGWAYARQGSYRSALSYIEEAIDLEKSSNDKGLVNPEILYHLAVVKNNLGDTDGAKKAATEALASPATPPDLATKIKAEFLPS